MRLNTNTVVTFCLSAFFVVLGATEAALGHADPVIFWQGAVLAAVGAGGVVVSLILSYRWNRADGAR